MTTQSPGALAPLVFRDTTFTVIDRNGEIWFKASELAQALGYSRTDSVSRIYENHKDEFSPSMTQIVDANSLKEATTESVVAEIKGLGDTSIRIFSLRGSHLIAIFSRTAVAKSFRVWVLDVLDRHLKTPPLPATTNQLQILKQLVRVLEEQEKRINELEQIPPAQICPAGLPIVK